MRAAVAHPCRAVAAALAQITARVRRDGRSGKRRSGLKPVQGTWALFAVDWCGQARAPEPPGRRWISGKAAKNVNQRPVIGVDGLSGMPFRSYPETGSLAPNPAALARAVVNHAQVEKRESHQWEDSGGESSSGCSTGARRPRRASSSCSAGDSTKQAEGILRTQHSGFGFARDERPKDFHVTPDLGPGRPTSQVTDSGEEAPKDGVCGRRRIGGRGADGDVSLPLGSRPVTSQRAVSAACRDAPPAGEGGAAVAACRAASRPLMADLMPSDAGWVARSAVRVKRPGREKPQASLGQNRVVIPEVNSRGKPLAIATETERENAIRWCAVRGAVRCVVRHFRSNAGVAPARQCKAPCRAATFGGVETIHAPLSAEVSEAALGALGDIRNRNRFDENGRVATISAAAAMQRASIREWRGGGTVLISRRGGRVGLPAFTLICKAKGFANFSPLAKSRCSAEFNRALAVVFSDFRPAAISGENFAAVDPTFASIRTTESLCISSLDTTKPRAAGLNARFVIFVFFGVLNLRDFFDRRVAAAKPIRKGKLFDSSCPNVGSCCAPALFERFGDGAMCRPLRRRGFSGRVRQNQKHIRRGELFDTSCPGAKNIRRPALDLSPAQDDRKPFIFSEFSRIVAARFAAPRHIRTAELSSTFGPGVPGAFVEGSAREGFAEGRFWVVNSGECLTEINAEKLPDFSKPNSQPASSESITGINSGTLPDVAISGLSESFNGINARTSRESASINCREAFARINGRAGDSPFEQARLADSSIRAFPVRAGIVPSRAPVMARASP